MGTVTPFRRSDAKSLARTNAYVETAFNIIALFRRRTMNALQDNSVIIQFDTEIEAKEFQKLIHSLPKRRK